MKIVRVAQSTVDKDIERGGFQASGDNGFSLAIKFSGIRNVMKCDALCDGNVRDDPSVLIFINTVSFTAKALTEGRQCVNVEGVSDFNDSFCVGLTGLIQYPSSRCVDLKFVVVERKLCFSYPLSFPYYSSDSFLHQILLYYKNSFLGNRISHFWYNGKL